MAEVEECFVDISKEQDGGLLKKILVEGTGDETPPPGSNVKVHYVGTLHSDGSKFDSSRDRPGFFEFDVGVGKVIKGWDQGICTMKKGEKCILRCRHDFAYGEHGSPPKIPGGATLNFEVELFSWKEKVPTPDEMSAVQRKEHAMKMKEQGTEAYKQGDFATAINRWEDGVEYITYDASADFDDEHEHGESCATGCCPSAGGGEAAALGDDEKALAIALLNNCAMAKLKVQDGMEAKAACDKVLGYDESNIKALFRRAQAEKSLGNFQAAAADAARCVELDPDNKEAEQLRRAALTAEKQAKQKEKAMFSKMFG